jgi:FkbM family methyltransferase
MMRRWRDLARKAWTYLLATLERPRELPHVARSVLGNHAHLGEVIKLACHRDWLRAAGINTVIDVGSHRGEFASAARAMLPHARIYCFEPLPDCVEHLHRIARRDSAMQVFAAALGNRSGPMTFYRSSFSESSSALVMTDLHRTAFPWTAGSTALTVEMRRLDEYLSQMDFAPRVLLKIDAQGYELEVLMGGLEVLRRVDYLLVEVSFKELYESQASFDDVYTLLKANGFSYAGAWDQLLSPLDGSILQADALFVREG